MAREDFFEYFGANTIVNMQLSSPAVVIFWNSVPVFFLRWGEPACARWLSRSHCRSLLHALARSAEGLDSCLGKTFAEVKICCQRYIGKSTLLDFSDGAVLSHDGCSWHALVRFCACAVYIEHLRYFWNTIYLSDMLLFMCPRSLRWLHWIYTLLAATRQTPLTCSCSCASSTLKK